MLPFTARCHAAYEVGPPCQRLFGIGRGLPTYIVISRLLCQAQPIVRTGRRTGETLEYNASMTAYGQVFQGGTVAVHGRRATERDAAPTGPR